jgi:hypothetical protein
MDEVTELLRAKIEEPIVESVFALAIHGIAP